MYTKKIEYLPPITEQAINKVKRRLPLAVRAVRFGFATVGRVFPGFAGKMAYRFFTTPRFRARHKVSDPIIERAQLFEVLYGKQILKAYAWGKGNRNILLVHGWESRGTALRSFVPELVEQGFRVIAFDGPAHGNSTGKRTNLPHFAGAVRAVINHVDGVYGIITHSFGGASTVFALTNNSPTTQVEKLVLIAVPDKISNIIQSAIDTMKVPASASRRFIKMIEQRLKTPLAEAQLSKANGRLPVKRALIVHDKNDTIVPFQAAQGIFDAWDNAALLVAEGMGHYKLVKNPTLIKKVVSFITG